MQGADLREADLQGADLRSAILGRANLHGVDLRGANLSGAYLQGANLTGADLSWANLSEADLQKADLERADLRGANLSGADLGGANLQKVIGKVLAIGPVGGAIGAHIIYACWADEKIQIQCGDFRGPLEEFEAKCRVTSRETGQGPVYKAAIDLINLAAYEYKWEEFETCRKNSKRRNSA
jgi:hypothetical protein